MNKNNNRINADQTTRVKVVAKGNDPAVVEGDHKEVIRTVEVVAAVRVQYVRKGLSASLFPS